MSDKAQDGWNEWSRHVLQELKRLNEGQEGIREEISSVKSGLSQLPVLSEQVKDIKEWKDNVTEVVSPTQLQQLVNRVESLQAFKIKAVTGFVLVQIVIGVVFGILA